MKISEAWLREWVDPPVSTEVLVAQLTNAGLEVDSFAPVAPSLEGIVIAEICSVARHPNADRLSLCEVSTGGSERVQVVCGAPNVREGMRSAFAPVGTRVADGTKIRKSKIRGVPSHGMLCSARELGLGDSHEGILDLPSEVAVGTSIESALRLADTSIEIDLTPNRGECLGIAGVAREVGAINRCEVAPPEIPLVKSTINDKFPVALEAPIDCPRYVSRVIRGIDPSAQTPLWMQEKLRRCGVRAISPVVDVTNYVMLELGQPMHAFDWQKLEGSIRVRKATEGETLVLLDGKEVALHPTTLVIADEKKPVAMAGVMGGLASGVSEDTVDIFLESAFFAPLSLIGQPRLYGLHTDASHRFERGVDPELQRRAAERATQLLLDIVGGEAGPIGDEVSAVNMPRRSPIHLRPARITRLLGLEVASETVADSLERLGMVVQASGEGWDVTPPSYRFDIAMEADLIEEVARMIGYDAVPTVSLPGFGQAPSVPEAKVLLGDLRRVLTERGYQEAVTYSFVDPKLQGLLEPANDGIGLANPISSELAVMRTTLWAGLLDAAQHNLHRQQARVRLFETGLVFFRSANRETPPEAFDQVEGIAQVKCIAGLITGSVVPEQWGEGLRSVDFFDAKSDVEQLIAHSRRPGAFRFAHGEHPALHPGQTAQILHERRQIGWLGGLNPSVAKVLKLNEPVFLFQLELAVLERGAVPTYASVSKFPAVRRDISLIVEDSVAASAVRESVGQASPDVLKNLEFFDVYCGEGIDPGKKSVAIGLTFQDDAKTLNDEEIDGYIDDIVAVLGRELGGVLRG